MITRVIAVFALACVTTAAWAAETDQFLVWDKELEDSAPALNGFLNAQAEEFVAKINARNVKVETREELAQEFYLHLFEWLLDAPVRKFLWESEDVDRFPESDTNFFEYQRMSIFRKVSVFPVVLPMARTVRLGDVYLGIDKIGHFFGFGRRYYTRYVGFLKEGDSPEDAMRRIVQIGIKQENSLVGGLTDGIYSHADLEANFQGFRMCRSLAEDGHFVQRDGAWCFEKPLDILPYITPDLDESWNNSHFQRRRKKLVLPLIVQEYCEKRDHPIVKARFERYAEYDSSFSKKVIEEYFMERRGRHPQRVQSLDSICDACEAEEPRQAMAAVSAESRIISASSSR